MPTFVTIFGRKIPIKYISPEKLSDIVQHAEGIWDPYSRTIYINKLAPTKIQIYYIYHEIGHAIMCFTGLDQAISDKIQEIICQSFATAMEDLSDQRARKK